MSSWEQGPPPPPEDYPPPPPPGYPPPGYPPPGPPGYPPPGYPPPGYPGGSYPPPAYYPSYAYAPKTDDRAIWALVLAIASFVVCPLILAVVALILASGAKRDIAASGGARQGAGLVTAATVIAWINIGVSVVALAGLLIIGIVASSSSSSVSGMLLAVASWSPH